MTTFRDILSGFESTPEISATAIREEMEQDPSVLSKPDIEHALDGVSRWCHQCEEYWPLEKTFFRRVKHKPGGFDTSCKVCVAEAIAKRGLRYRTPANSPGSLSVYFPEAPTQSCSGCQRMYPLLGLFWRQNADSGCSAVCLSCTPISQKPVHAGSQAHAN